MSVLRVARIECDGEGCDNAYPFTAGSAREHRDDLQRLGWRIAAHGGRDYCPRCRRICCGDPLLPAASRPHAGRALTTDRDRDRTAARLALAERWAS